MKALIWILNTLFGAVVVAMVALMALVLFFDPNDYKARLVDAVGDATGRKLTIGGELRLTKSLWPTLEATDVSLSNIEGGSRPAMVHVERIEGQLSLLALLHRTVDITRLVLIGPNILFEQVGSRPNWVFDRAEPSAPPPPTPPLVPDGAVPTQDGYDLRVRRAAVRNGMVTWKLPARTKVVGIRVLDYRQVRRSGPLEARSTLVYADNQPFGLDIAAEPTGGVMDPWQTRLHFSAFDSEATATGSVQLAGAYALQVDATSPALEKLNALLPEMGLPPLRQAALQAHLANGAEPGDLPVIGPATLRFAAADLRSRVPGLQLGATRVTLPAAGGQAAIDSGGQYAGAPFRLTGSVGVPTHPDGATSLPVALTAAFTGSASGTGTLKGTVALDKLRFAGLDGAATLAADALASLRPVAGEGLPALTAVRFGGQVTVPASGRPVRLRGVTLRTDQGELSGDGSLDPAGPSLSGTWRSPSLDGDALLQAFGIELSGTAGSATGPMIPNAALPWASLRGPALDLELSVASLRLFEQTWQDVQAAVTRAGGRLRAGPVSVAMPGARVTATLAVDAAAAGTPASLSLAAPAVPLQLLGRWFGVPGPMAGSAAVQAQVRGRGATVRSVASTLDGTVSVAAVGGQLTNRALIGLTGAALEALGITVPPAGETRLECLGIAGSFQAGVGTLRPIALETTYLSLEGVGQVDLGRETVALRLQPLAQVAGSPVAVPVVVQGPFRSVSGKLDAGGLEQLGFLLNGIFGGDTSAACEKAGLAPRR